MPSQRECHRGAGYARGLDELVQAGEARLRVPGDLRARVIAEDAEQPPHLGQRVARGLADRLEVRAALLGQALGRETRALGLDGDRRDVVRDDVVQVACDARALPHRRLVLEGVDHRLTRLVALGERLAALPARVAERQSRDDDHEEQDAREPASSPEKGTIALKTKGNAGSTDQRRP